MRWLNILLAAGCWVLGPAGQAEDPLPVTPDAPAEAAGAAAPAPEKLPAPALGGMDQLLPVGKTALEVTVPTLDDLGRLVSLTEIERVTRTDDTHFRLEGLTLTSFEPERLDPGTGRPLATQIRIEAGLYDATARTLTTETPCAIQKPEFLLNGQGLVYDSQSGVGVVKGPVKMTIFSTLHSPEASLQPQNP